MDAFQPESVPILLRHCARVIASVEDALTMSLDYHFQPLTTALLQDCLPRLVEVRRILLRLSARR